MDNLFIYLKYTKSLRLIIVGLLLLLLLAGCADNTPTVAPPSTTMPVTSMATGIATTVTVTPDLSATTANSVGPTNSLAASTKPGSSPTPALTTVASSTPATSKSGTTLPTPTPLDSTSLRSFMSNDYQFGMAYPSAWGVSVITDEQRSLFSSPESPYYAVSIDVTKTVTGQNAQQALQLYLNALNQRYPSLAISNPAIGDGAGGLDEVGAYIIFVAPNDPKLSIKAFVEKVVNGSNIYTVIASSEADKYAQREPLLQLCLNSFLPLNLTSNTKKPLDTQTFQNAGIKMNYPKAWTLQPKSINAGTVLTVVNPQSPDARLELQVASGQDPAKFNAASFDVIRTSAADSIAVRYDLQKLSSTQTMSRWMILIISGSGYPIYHNIYTIADVKTGLLYSLQVSALATNYLENADAFAAMVSSFTIAQT